MNAASIPPPRMHWGLLLAAAATLMITMGARQTTGLFVAPIHQDTGIGIAAISFALAIGQFTWGAVQPVFGAIADKRGSTGVLVLGAVLLALGLAIVLGTLGVPLSGVALHFMQPSAELDQLTREFFHTRLFGLPAALASYALVGWFLGTQNARAPLAILLSTNLINIALNLWFVIGLEWGVVGSARASVIAEWSGALLGLWLTRGALRAYPGHIAWAALKVWQNWRPLLAVNRDIFIRSLALQSVFFLITVQGARLGDATVAANALLLNGLLLTAHALDGLAHAIEALCGHAIGARDHTSLRRALVVACGWSLITSVGFAVLFLLGGHLFIDLQTDIDSVRAAAYPYLPYLAVLPVVAVWSYLLDGLFIGATRAREMRNAMLVSVVIALPVAWGMSGFGNHGLWLAFLGFMALRAVTLGWVGWRLQQKGLWIR